MSSEIPASDGHYTDDASEFPGPVATDLGAPTLAEAPADSPASKAVDDVLYSDIGVNTLLNRLKQSIASARDFAGFLKKRSSIEEDHAQGLKKLCKSTSDLLRRQESRQGSYATHSEEVMRVHERMAENGMSFALSLHQMHEDLTELSNTMERGRKQWKATGLSAEKKAADAEGLMEKAKAKYDALAEDYDRVRTGDKSSKHVFGLKGPKSAAQQEEDIHKKLQAADADYLGKVHAAQGQRQELVQSARPQAVKALQYLIAECDAALTLQLQKFASFNEKLLLGNGVLITPIPAPTGRAPEQRSLREMVSLIDNDTDLRTYLASVAPKIPPRTADITYIKHPSQASASQPPPSSSHPPPTAPPPPSQPSQPPSHLPSQPPPSFPTPPAQPPPLSQYSSYGSQPFQPPPSAFTPPPQYHPPPRDAPYAAPAYPSHPGAQAHTPQSSGVYSPAEPPALQPVFGVGLDELFERDGQPVPMVVGHCIQAVDLFGLDVEGIYRVPGTASAIQKMKARLNHDVTNVDFRNPESFYHDVNSVAGLLKQWFRELPDPLLTSEHYTALIDSARVDDDTVRRDSLHAIINALPDPNYATLRALVFHLHRVQEHAAANRMSSSNLAICLAPSLMGQHRGPMADAGLQARVIDTILHNTFQIFEED